MDRRFIVDGLELAAGDPVVRVVDGRARRRNAYRDRTACNAPELDPVERRPGHPFVGNGGAEIMPSRHWVADRRSMDSPEEVAGVREPRRRARDLQLSRAA